VHEQNDDDRTGKQGSGGVAAFAGIGTIIGIGAGIGLIFGTMLDALALGLACGAGLGVVVGAIAEAHQRRG
jgi:hypothetical protein